MGAKKVILSNGQYCWNFFFNLLLLQLFISPKRRAYIFRVFFYLQITNYDIEKNCFQLNECELIAEIGVLPGF